MKSVCWIRYVRKIQVGNCERMDEELTEGERQQIQKLISLQKVVGIILAKWIWFLVFLFFLLATAFAVFLIWHTARSEHRYSATTRILYTPRQIARIQNMSEKQLFSVLERASLKRRLPEKVLMSPRERQGLVSDLDIQQERRPTNLFTLKANAPSLISAVKKVNGYAELLIEEYVSYRTKDLESWRESLLVRKHNLQVKITELETEESSLKGKAGVVAPVETLTMLNGLLSDQRRNLSQLSVQVANAEMKKKKLEAAVGTIGPAVTANADAIRKKSAEIAAIDKELAQLREIYTDKNPKVMGKMDDRKNLLDAYMAFLKEKGIEGVDVGAVNHVEKDASELAECSLRLEVLKQNRSAQEREIQDNEKRSSELTALIPLFERLRVKKADLEQSMRSLDEELSNIAYLETSMRNDLRQIERAVGADDTRPFRMKNFLLAIVGAGMCTLALFVWILMLELLWGKVRGGKELAAYEGVHFLGSLPKPKAMKEIDEKDFLGVVALKFVNAELPRGIVLVCHLPGANPQPKFRESLLWSLAMGGAQSFSLEVVSENGFTAPEGAVTMINTVQKGLQGWFPVENKYVMAPTEFQMLQADLVTLRSQYEHVFIDIADGVRRGGSFFEQLLSACDSLLVVVGAGKTPRSWFSYVRRHAKAVQKPMMAIAAGVSARGVRREMEAR